MKKKYKLISVLSLIGLFFFLNSNLFLNFLAERKRNNAVKKYQEMLKPYLYEGVYETYDDVYTTYSNTNDFGIKDDIRKFKNSRKILLYFSSDKFIIDYPYEVAIGRDLSPYYRKIDSVGIKHTLPKRYLNVQEEFLLSSEWSYCTSNAVISKKNVKKILWETKVIGWRLIDKKTKKVLQDFSSQLLSKSGNNKQSVKKLMLFIDTEKEQGKSSIIVTSQTLSTSIIALSDFVDKNKTLLAYPDYFRYSTACSSITNISNYKCSSIFEEIKDLISNK